MTPDLVTQYAVQWSDGSIERLTREKAETYHERTEAPIMIRRLGLAGWSPWRETEPKGVNR